MKTYALLRWLDEEAVQADLLSKIHGRDAEHYQGRKSAFKEVADFISREDSNPEIPAAKEKS